MDQLRPRDARWVQMEVDGMSARSRDGGDVGTSSTGKPAGGSVWKHR